MLLLGWRPHLEYDCFGDQPHNENYNQDLLPEAPFISCFSTDMTGKMFAHVSTCPSQLPEVQLELSGAPGMVLSTVFPS